MVRVDTVGVRNRLWIFAKALGMALNTAIDSVVRGRSAEMVVCVDAAAELNTMSRSSLVRKLPKPDVPKMEVPSTDSTSPAWLGFYRPMPFVPIPA